MLRGGGFRPGGGEGTTGASSEEGGGRAYFVTSARRRRISRAASGFWSIFPQARPSLPLRPTHTASLEPPKYSEGNKAPRYPW